jgi:hypothetical protein
MTKSYEIANEKILEHTPAAHGASVVMCTAPECSRPHIVLFDEDGIALLQFPVPEDNPDGTGFFAALKAAMERGVH